MYVNITRCRGKQKNIHISIITHNSLFFSKIELGNLYLNKYYSKIEFENPPKKTLFLRKSCIQEAQAKNEKKNSNRAAR